MKAELVKTDHGIELQISPETEIESIALDLFDSEHYIDDDSVHSGIVIFTDLEA